MDSAEKNILETSSRCNTPLGIKPIFDFNNENENIPFLLDDMDDFGRESLGIINFDNLDGGRESLWIANIKPSDVIGLDLSEVKSGSDCDILNTAFVLPAKDSTRSSPASCDSISPSLSLLNIPSRINFNTHVELNRKSSISPDFSEKLNNFSHLHQIDSLSSMLEDIMKVQIDYKEKSFFKSTRKLKNSSFITESNEGFDDSVFIEANHLAARFEDGSIYDLEVGENDMLDSIREPEDLVNLSNDNVEPVIQEKEAVFKMIDKILPSNQNLSLPVPFKENNCDNESKSTVKGKNPKDILSTLSDILNNDNLISEKQKFEGQNMISNLAAILISNANGKQNHLDDSGHSSIETEAMLTSPENECYEVLDLRKEKTENCQDTKSTEICVPLDLSLKSKIFNFEQNSTPKILQIKFNNNRLQSLNRPSDLDKGYSISNNENKKFDDFKNKFKLKRIEENSNLKRGPMRAMVPLDNMAKRKSGSSKLPMTPKRSDLQSNLRKPGTPVNGLILKPVAQSTPEVIVSTTTVSSNKSNSTDPSGKVAKPKSSYSRSSLYNINKSQDLKTKKIPFIRRHSVDDMKKGQEDVKVLSRSSSLGGKTGLISVGNNGHKSVATNKQNSRSSVRSLPVLKENRSKSVTRSSFGRRNGKENLY